jgi:hypothetical protein
MDMELKYLGTLTFYEKKITPEAQAIFPNPFTVCSLCKWKFVVCLFVDEETNGNYRIRLQTD